MSIDMSRALVIQDNNPFEKNPLPTIDVSISFHQAISFAKIDPSYSFFWDLYTDYIQPLFDRKIATLNKQKAFARKLIIAFLKQRGLPPYLNDADEKASTYARSFFDDRKDLTAIWVDKKPEKLSDEDRMLFSDEMSKAFDSDRRKKIKYVTQTRDLNKLIYSERSQEPIVIRVRQGELLWKDLDDEMLQDLMKEQNFISHLIQAFNDPELIVDIALQGPSSTYLNSFSERVARRIFSVCTEFIAESMEKEKAVVLFEEVLNPFGKNIEDKEIELHDLLPRCLSDEERIEWENNFLNYFIDENSEDVKSIRERARKVLRSPKVEEKIRDLKFKLYEMNDIFKLELFVMGFKNAVYDFILDVQDAVNSGTEKKEEAAGADLALPVAIFFLESMNDPTLLEQFILIEPIDSDSLRNHVQYYLCDMISASILIKKRNKASLPDIPDEEQLATAKEEQPSVVLQKKPSVNQLNLLFEKIFYLILKKKIDSTS